MLVKFNSKMSESVTDGEVLPAFRSRVPLRPMKPMPMLQPIPSLGGAKNAPALPTLPVFKRPNRRQTAPSFGKITPVKPLTEEVKEIPGLLSNCTFNFGKTFVPCDGKAMVSPYDTKEIDESLKSLERILERDGVFELLTSETARLILEKMSRGLFRKCSDIPKKYIFCDQRVTLTVAERNIYLAMYRILAKTVKRAELQRVKDWATPRVLRSLIECWDTPDEAEDMGIELAISSLCERLPETKKQFYDIVVEKLEDEEAKHTFLIASLRWLVVMHTRDLSISPDAEVFKKAIMPLFRSPYLPMFMNQLDQLAGVFYGYFDELPELVIEYMFKHWPMTDSNKGSCYMHHIKTLVSAMGAEALQRVTVQLFGEIVKAIESPNTNFVALSALELLADRAFVSLFSETAVDILPGVYHSIQTHMSGWDGDLSKNASLALEVIRSLLPECENKDVATVDDTNKAGNEWMMLAEEVARDHPEFDKQKFAENMNDSMC